ncbi:hypothetical protein BDQ94DRAFT_144073, partial [Aspergillus welwitschiae]
MSADSYPHRVCLVAGWKILKKRKKKKKILLLIRTSQIPTTLLALPWLLSSIL